MTSAVSILNKPKTNTIHELECDKSKLQKHFCQHDLLTQSNTSLHLSPVKAFIATNFYKQRHLDITNTVLLIITVTKDFG